MSTPRLRMLIGTFLAVALSACQDGGQLTAPVDDLDLMGAHSVIIDFEAGDGAQFLFLQPLSDGVPTAPLATGLDLTVTVCDLTTGDPCEEMSATEEDDHYHANWKSDKALSGNEFSVVVTGGDVPIGGLTIGLESKGSEKAGRNFPIKFWVGEALGDVVESLDECFGSDRCNASFVPEAQPTTITTEDENGSTMAQLTVPATAVPTGGLILTLDCRVGGYAPTEGPLPTDLNQWPLFCHVDARNADGSPFVGILPDDAALEICVVDELEPGQGPYHAFPDHDDLVLGKSADGVTFEFLPDGPEALSCVGTTTTIAAATGPRRWFDAVGSRVASALGVLMPEKLYARAMMFRDGGVGGLIRSFSDINPVEPASISGMVTNSGGGALVGATVTLSGDASATTTTDGTGNYSFGPLQAADGGGSSYTVTVSALPTNESLEVPSQVVAVPGSGTFTADFQTAAVYFNPATGNYYGAVSTAVPWATAKAAAEGLTFASCVGHLATPTSAAENAFIVTNMPEAINTVQGGYWIGGFQPSGSTEPGGGWSWVTGETFGPYTNWGTAEPNNSGGAEDSMQFLGGWTPTQRSMWNDEPGTRSYGYVVEYACPA